MISLRTGGLQAVAFVTAIRIHLRFLIWGTMLLLAGANTAFPQQPSQLEPRIQQAASERDQLYAQGDFEAARQRAEEVLRLAGLIPDESGLLIPDSKVRLAMILKELDRNEEAAALYAEACPVFVAKTSERDVRRGLCLHSQAMVLLWLGRLDEARQAYEPALDNLNVVMGKDRAASAAFVLAEALKEVGADHEAIKYFEDAARVFKEAPDTVGFAITALSEIAELYQRNGRVPDVVDVKKEALALIERFDTQNVARLASLRFELADILIAVGQFDEALVLLQQVKSALVKVSRTEHAGPEAVLTRIAGLQIGAGSAEGARSTLKEAMAVVAQKPARERRELTVELGLQFLDHAELSKNYSQAKSFIEDLLKLDDEFFDSWRDKSATADELREILGSLPNRIAIYQLNRSEFVEARNVLSRSLERARTVFGTETRQVMDILMRLGAQALAQQDPQSAVQRLREAVEISKKVSGDHHELRYAYAQALRQAGHNELAQREIKISLEMQEAVEKLSPSLLLRQSVKMRETNKDDVRAARLIAELAHLQDPDRPSIVSHLAGLYAEERDWPKAFKFAERAVELRVARYGANHMNTAGAVYNLGRTYWQAGEREEAMKAFERSATTMSNVVGQMEDQFSVAEFQLTLPSLIDSWRSALLSMSDMYENKVRLYDQLAPWKGRIEDALRNRYSTARIGATPEGRMTFARLQIVRNRIAIWSQRQAQTESKLWHDRFWALIAEKEQLERELGALMGEAPTSEIAVSASAVASVLNDSDVFVDIIRYTHLDDETGYRGRYAAFVIHRNGPPKFVPLESSASIETAIKDWRATLLQDARSPWRFLKSLAFDPISKELRPEVRRIWISPDSALATIPWHLFPENDEIVTQQVNSARDFIRGAKRNSLPKGSTSKRSMLIVGNLEYGKTATAEHPVGECWEALEGTRAEIEQVGDDAIAAGLTSKLLEGQKATKERVVSLLETSSIAHFATHGYFSPREPTNLSGCAFKAHTPKVGTSGDNGNAATRIPFARSGLALSGANAEQKGDGFGAYLTADDFLGMQLAGLDLVVLSACETGLGDTVSGQGVLGLRTAVAAAGARVLLMSLWRVDDTATNELMREFYSGLWKQDLSPALALRKAQMKLSQRANRKAPHYWAGWVVVGQ